MDNTRTDGGMFAQVVETSIPMPAQDYQGPLTLGDADSPQPASVPTTTGMMAVGGSR